MTRRRAYSEPVLTSADQKHRAALLKEIDRLRWATPVGWKSLTGYVPEMEDLREALVVLLELADPRKGRNLDSSGRGGYDPLSSDGRSTVEGRQTLPDRDRLDYFRRQIKNLAREMAESRDPDLRRPQVPKVRCRRAECHGRDRRQPADTVYCRWCGMPIAEKKPPEGLAKVVNLTTKVSQ